MTTIVLDSDYSDELLHIKEDPFEYGPAFVMDDLYDPNQQKYLKDNHHNNEVQLLAAAAAAAAAAAESCRASDCSSSEEDYDLNQLQCHAPPPSPQDTCMLDMFFSQKLTSSLEACLMNQSPSSPEQEDYEEEEQEYISTIPSTQDRKLYRSHSTTRGVCKRRKSVISNKQQQHKRSLSSNNNCANNNITLWQQRAQNQKLINIAKATEQAEKLRNALQKHIVDEETKFMINELKDMGL